MLSRPWLPCLSCFFCSWMSSVWWLSLPGPRVPDYPVMHSQVTYTEQVCKHASPSCSSGHTPRGWGSCWGQRWGRGGPAPSPAQRRQSPWRWCPCVRWSASLSIFTDCECKKLFFKVILWSYENINIHRKLFFKVILWSHKNFYDDELFSLQCSRKVGIITFITKFHFNVLNKVQLKNSLCKFGVLEYNWYGKDWNDLNLDLSLKFLSIFTKLPWMCTESRKIWKQHSESQTF